MTLSTPATSLWLDDGLTVFAPPAGSLQEGTGKYLGMNRVFYTGSDTVPWYGHVGVNLSELRITAKGSQQYWFVAECSTTEDFTGPKIDAATMALQVMNEQFVLAVRNVFDGVIYPYIRLKWRVNSVVVVWNPSAPDDLPEHHTPRIKALVFLKPLASIPSYSLADLITIQSVMAANIQNHVTNFRAWMTGTAYGGIGGDGRYPLSDGMGNVVYVKCPAQWAADSHAASPIYYGAIGDGNSHKARDFYPTLEALQAVYPFAISLDQEMDYLGIQKALKSRRRVDSVPMHYVCCNNDGDPQVPIVAISGENMGHMEGSLLNFMTMMPKVEMTYVNANRNFVDNTAWYNSPVYVEGTSILYATFGGGKATLTDIYTDGKNPFYRFGQQITAPAGNYVLRCRGKAMKGVSYATNPNPPFFSVGFSNGSDLEGYGPRAAGGVDFNLVTEQEFELRTELNFAEDTTTWLAFTAGGYVSFEIYEFTLTPVLLNCGILATRDGATDHYPLQLAWGGFLLYGPGAHVTGLSGIKHTSFKNTDGNHNNWGNLRISGWENGAYYGNGAYLINYHESYIIGNRRGIHFPKGNMNAGENNKFNMGVLASNGSNICNPGGGGFTFYGTACDYPEISYGYRGLIEKNAGRLSFQCCHMEAKPVGDDHYPLIECIENGYVIMDDGVILLSPGVCKASPFRLFGSPTEIHFGKTQLFNIMPDAGLAWCTDDSSGRITGKPWWGPNPTCGPIISKAPSMDILARAGTFEDVQGVGSTNLVGTDHGIAIEGAVFTNGYLARQYGQWNSNVLSTEIIDAPDGSGRCMRVRNLYTQNDVERELGFLFPVTEPGQHIFPVIEQFFPGATTDYGGPQFIFDEDHKSSALSLTNGGRTAEYPGSGAPITPIPGGTSLAPGLPAEPTRMFINAAIGTAANTFARSAEPVTGENYFEFRIDAISAQNGGLRVGLTNQSTLTELGAAGSIAYGSPEIMTGINMGSRVRSNGVDLGLYGERVNWAVGDHIGMMVSTERRTVCFRRNNGQWTPEQRHFLDGPVYPVIGIQSEGDRITINAGRADFVYEPPMGSRPAEHRASQEVVAASGTAILYRRTFWVRKIGEDKYGRPRFGKMTLHKGEYNYEVPLAGSPDWHTWTPQTLYENFSTNPADGRCVGAPDWATHLLTLVGFGAQPYMSYFFRIPFANRL